ELIPSLPDSRIERNPHPRLNIHAYPALYLMQPPNNILLLRQGGSSFTDLAGTIVRVAYANNLISEQDYKLQQATYEVWDRDSRSLYKTILIRSH
ncbi:MAG: hypothetical protein ACR2PT_02215, partial [Endozoicomonas sp.]